MGVFRHILQGVEDFIDYPYDDGAGVVYLNESKKVFSVGPFRNWEKTPVFFTDGVGMEESDPGEAAPFAAIGFSPRFYIRMAAELMVLRYTIKKSLMRVIQKRSLPQPPRVFIRSKPTLFNFQSFGDLFDELLKGAKFKNFLFAFLISKKKGGPAIKNNFRLFSAGVRRLISLTWGARKLRRRSARRSVRKFLKLKKEYFLFKKKHFL